MVKRWYEGGEIPVLFTNRESNKIDRIKKRPGRDPNAKNWQSASPWKNMVLDIMKYFDRGR